MRKTVANSYVSSPFYTTNLIAVAIEASGKTALGADRNVGRLERLYVGSPVTTLATARQSATVLRAPYGVAVEAGGATAVVTDNCGIIQSFPCTAGDSIVARVD